tara:strand:+ start:1704 stop:2183 length:480 start_codon:yes stop_codon:yes gene_type:complete
MAVKLDNLDDVMKQLAKMADDSGTVVIREARKNMKATLRKYLPVFKSVTPRQSGNMAKSLKIRSRSRRGVTQLSMMWDIKAPAPKPKEGKEAPKKAKKSKKFINYSGFVNFGTANKKSPLFASDKFNEIKSSIDAEGLEDVKDAFRKVFKANGIKVIEK